MKSLCVVVSIGLACAPLLSDRAHAGVMEWFRATTQRPSVAPDKAQSQIKRYLERVLKREDFQIAKPRSILTAGERNLLDAHVMSRVDRFEELAVAEVSARKMKGMAILAGHGLSKGSWEPAKGYVAYVSLLADEPFPGNADQAQSLVVHKIGEPGLFGFFVEAGPLWKVTEKYLMGAMPGDGMAQFVGTSGETEVSGSGASAEEIPAWVVRGWTELIWKGTPKPLEMGVLVAILREKSAKVSRIIHVTGVGPISRGIFAGGIRQGAKEDEDE